MNLFNILSWIFTIIILIFFIKIIIVLCISLFCFAGPFVAIIGLVLYKLFRSLKFNIK
jgi:hypothetical protein